MRSLPDPDPDRKPQLAYSQLQNKTRDEVKRRRKAAKIVSVLEHFLGRADMNGLTALDVGSSTGYTVEALANEGATVTGIDIDAPGIEFARQRLGDRATFIVADGAAIPLGDASVDVVVFSHIYEHVVDPDAVIAEIVRVLRCDGVAYLAFGNRRAVIEPHYRLPFLSWAPPKLADRYVRMFKRADEYYERFRTRPQLVRMCGALSLWDYTYTVLADSDRFHATDMVPRRLASVPPHVWRTFAPVMPTFIWVGTPRDRVPAGTATRQAPTRIWHS